MKFIRQVGLAVYLGALFAFLCSSPALLQAEEEHRELTTIERKIRVSVQRAEPGSNEPPGWAMLLVTSSGPYDIIEETKVEDAAGKEISMDSLPVPCQAEITYQPLRNYQKNALKIAVKTILPKASTKWSAPLPQ